MAKNANDNPLIIPFGKATRVGNFKLWRGNYTLGRGKDKTDIECVHVSSIDGSYMVRIPATSGMFSFICNQYATTDPDMRDNILGMVFTNFYNIVTTPSPVLHDALFFLTEMLTFPYLILSEDEMRKRMAENLRISGIDDEKAIEHINKMAEYRKQLWELIEKKKDTLISDYEQQLAERRGKEEEAAKELEHDELAEQAINELNKQEGV